MQSRSPRPRHYLEQLLLRPHHSSVRVPQSQVQALWTALPLKRVLPAVSLRAKKWARIGRQHPKLVLTAEVMFMHAYILQHGEVFEFPGFAARVCGFS